MEIILNKQYKIDISAKQIEERPEYQNIENFKKYIHGMLEQIGTKEPDRLYKFKSDYTEIRTLLNKILIENEYDNSCTAIANRLLDKEVEAQNDLNKKKLGKEILKGMLIVALVKMTDEAQKIIILKVDYDEFLSEMTGDIVTGLSIRKKVYKAFIGELNNNHDLLNLSIYDTNSPVSAYWWSKFLELEVIITDEENTKNAFHAIETEVLNPLKKKHKQDYLHLWNATVACFRSEGEFNLSHYRDELIGNYTPYDENLKISDLQAKIDKLPSKHEFDQRFNKVPTEVQKKFKNDIQLTKEIKLTLLHDIPNIKKTFKAHEDADGKYLMILSDEGYNYAKKVEQGNEDSDE
jgi:hypothetical protein